MSLKTKFSVTRAECDSKNLRRASAFGFEDREIPADGLS